MKYLLLLLVVPVLAGAAHCFIWNYQATDTIYDPEAGATVDHTYWLRQLLTSQGHTFVMDTLLPSNTSAYDVVFAMCGWYNCWSDCRLALEEQQILVDRLNAGKAVYIENPELGYAHSGTTLYQMLGATYLGDGNDYSTGNVQTVAGRTGTFTTGMSLGYMYQQAPDNWVDYIGANTGTLIFASQDNNGRAVCYAGPGNSYRSIYATFNFGALRNTTSTKQQLLIKYLEYLLPTTVAEDRASDAIQNLIVGPNPGRGRIGITFLLTGPEPAAVAIFDVAGQKVRDLAVAGLNPGVNCLTWDGQDDRGQAVGAGTYIVRVEAGGVRANQTVVLIK